MGYINIAVPNSGGFRSVLRISDNVIERKMSGIFLALAVRVDFEAVAAACGEPAATVQKTDSRICVVGKAH
jgi:hypothetical protein